MQENQTLEELSTLSLEDFAKLCDSRARRSILKGVNEHVLKKVRAAKENPKAKPVRTHRRDLIILPEMIGVRFAIYKGNSFELVDVNEKMLGHFIGEFVFTRKRLLHGKAGIGATKSSTAITAR
jgi:small subunit ribosomal protein S19